MTGKLEVDEKGVGEVKRRGFASTKTTTCKQRICIEEGKSTSKDKSINKAKHE